jgi:NADH dehydrogenase [ubiquinone] 1 alpha subcomplex assembly factor 6
VKGETTDEARLGLSAVAEMVRRHDRDRYRIALFAPVDRREALFALYAFNYEIARTRESVTEPMLGQIRLQWWREVIAAAYDGTPVRRHEVALPLAAAIRQLGLSRHYFERLIDGRERDLDDAPPASLTLLEDYAEATSASLVHLACEALGARSDHDVAAAHHVGIAFALTGLLRAMPFHARAGRCYIPDDIAASVGLDSRSYAEMTPTPGLQHATEQIAQAATAHLATAREYRQQISRTALPALLPAIVADRGLAQLRRVNHNPFDPRVAAADPLLSWRLAVAMLRRRF